MWLTIGAERVDIRRRIEAVKKKKAPILMTVSAVDSRFGVGGMRELANEP